ncbi:hypothetical protein KKI17_00080 [Patescibacteria group bacterium]|nr:hypothetical protein [Patescibacteria group bacterium]
MVELRGTDMVFGQEVQGEQVGQDIYAILAGIAGVVGSILLFAAGSQGPMLRGIAGVLGAACLVVLQIKANSDLKAQGQGVTIEYQIGYWLALLFFIGAALANYIPLGQEGEEDQGRSPP